jgi:hypothetical protein
LVSFWAGESVGIATGVDTGSETYTVTSTVLNTVTAGVEEEVGTGVEDGVGAKTVTTTVSVTVTSGGTDKGTVLGGGWGFVIGLEVVDEGIGFEGMAVLKVENETAELEPWLLWGGGWSSEETPLTTSGTGSGLGIIFCCTLGAGISA